MTSAARAPSTSTSLFSVLSVFGKGLVGPVIPSEVLGAQPQLSKRLSNERGSGGARADPERSSLWAWHEVPSSTFNQVGSFKRATKTYKC